jgi:hypothetical protein
MNQKPIIFFESMGPSGNIYAVLSAVRHELHKRRRINEYNEVWERVQNAKSYEEALQIIGEKVNIIDLSKP